PGARGAQRACDGPRPAPQRARECPPRRPVARGCRPSRLGGDHPRPASHGLSLRSYRAYGRAADGWTLGAFSLGARAHGAGATALVAGAGKLRHLAVVLRFWPGESGRLYPSRRGGARRRRARTLWLLAASLRLARAGD